MLTPRLAPAPVHSSASAMYADKSGSTRPNGFRQRSKLHRTALLDENAEYTGVSHTHVRIYECDDPNAFTSNIWRMCCSDEQITRIEERVIPAFEDEGGGEGNSRVNGVVERRFSKK